MADSLPFSKISIPGPTLSSLLHHSLSSPSSSLSGLLFGHVTALPSPEPTDSDPSPSLSSSLSLTITSFLSSPPPFLFFDSLGLINPNSPLFLPLQYPNSSPLLLGWFSSRPFSPLRPSMRDISVSHHLSKTLNTLHPDSKPPIFLLFSSFSTANQAIHTHEYRAFFLFRSAFRPISVDVINVGPKFRGQYGSFLPEASSVFPMMPCRARDSDEGEGFMDSESRGSGSENGEEKTMDWSVGGGFGVERLEGLVGERAAEYAKEVEDFYGKMMEKLEGLVRMVEESSAMVQEQETRNAVLRSKIASAE